MKEKAANLLEILKSNKKVYLPTKEVDVPFIPKKAKKNSSKQKYLGKEVGYCPTCMIYIGELELGSPCTRCGAIITKETVEPCHNPRQLAEWRYHEKWGNSTISSAH